MKGSLYLSIYQEENNMLLKYILDKMFFDAFDATDEKARATNSRVELFITPTCNLKCSYCYVYKHGEELYPSSINNKDIILKNLKNLLDWFRLNNKTMHMIDLFSGEIWGNSFGYDVLNTILDFYKIFRISKVIVIPSNMTFLFSENGEEKIQYFIDEFNKLGTRLIFSASVDGLYLEDSFRAFKSDRDRELISRNEKYYDKIFSFCSKNNFLFHPMVDSKSCKYWIENFDWYQDMFMKYYHKYMNLMMLEVRDDNWTDEDIYYHHILLKHVAEFKLYKLFDGDIKKFAYSIAKIDNKSKSEHNNVGVFRQGNRLTCGIQNTICIRLGDMAILPCHRTSYEPNIYGYIKIDGKDMHIESKNVELAVRIYSMNPNFSHPKCDTCSFNQLCSKGCLGSQFETNTDLFQVCDSVCKMEKEKIKFLINLYKDWGVWDILKEEPKAAGLIEIVYSIIGGNE